MTDGGLGTTEESRFDGMPHRGRLRMPQERHPKARQTGPSELGRFALAKTVRRWSFAACRWRQPVVRRNATESGALTTRPFGQPKWDLFECLRLEFGGLVWQEPCASGASQHAEVYGEFVPKRMPEHPTACCAVGVAFVWGIECPCSSRVERSGSEAEEPKPSHSRNLGRPHCRAEDGIKAGNYKLPA